MRDSIHLNQKQRMKTMVMIPNISKQKVKNFEEVEETTGILKKDYDENKIYEKYQESVDRFEQ